jgi:hypothetical protein
MTTSYAVPTRGRFVCFSDEIPAAAVLVRLDDGPGGVRYTVLSAKGVSAGRLDATPGFDTAVRGAMQGEVVGSGEAL